MNATLDFAADYLLNSLWQVPLLFFAAWVLARATRQLGPLTEHRVWLGALLLQTVLPACSVPELAAIGHAWHRFLAGATGTSNTVTVTLGSAKPLGSAGMDAQLMRIALVLYTLTTASFVVRFLWQWWRLQPIREGLQVVTLCEEDAKFFASCLRQWNLRNVQLASSAAVPVPITFGWRKPRLLLPSDFAERMHGPKLQATLGHELAHVRRSDYAKHLLFRIVTLPVAYHPLLWSTLARVAETRELVCDAMAAELTGNRKQFARSLLELASLLIDSESKPSHAIGMFDANRFERRILMLHQKEMKASRALRVGLLALSALTAITTCMSAVAMRLHVDGRVDQPDASLERPATVADDSVRVPSGVMAGQIVSKVQPKYPEEAKKAKIQGTVLLKAIIGKTGLIENLQVISGPEELRASALEAVRQWVYKPYLQNGEPTEVETTVTVNYSFGG